MSSSTTTNSTTQIVPILDENVSTPLTTVVPLGIKEYIPFCQDGKKPKLGQIFESLEQGVSFYREYAKIFGFTSRLATTRSKDGSRYDQKRKCETISANNVELPESTQTRSREILKWNLYISPESMMFLKENRNMTFVQKNFIVKTARLKLGGVKAFRGPSEIDFKNLVRDMKKYIGHFDGQMFIENFKRKKETYPSFYFNFQVNEHGRLSRVFWADTICIKNYLLFGDMLSVDSTFRTNRCNMVFVPFTGVDHHKRCVTFGAGLLAHEDVESYEWLFATFMDAMGNCQPKVLITDQDPMMKIAIAKVLPETNHRLCMWHIMKKLREKWIPAFFKDIFMGGLMRVTSRSESENSFFDRFVTPHVTLVEFWMCFESAMDAQRHKQSKLNSDNKSSIPQLKTPLALEVHASEIYTHNVFKDFKDELCAALYKCGMVEMSKNVDYEVFKNKNLKRIPEKYIVHRWTKAAMNKPVFDKKGRLLDPCVTLNDTQKLTAKLWEEVYSCVSVVEDNDEDMEYLIQKLGEIKLDVKRKRNNAVNKKDKAKEMEKYVGCSGKRIESEVQKALEKHTKKPRYCKICGGQGHDSRNCKGNMEEKGMFI
ncbi:hypothetical protein RND81_02G119900 [Saponaria officinalis]|uniref:MULE transposase domain-containing protein n=1 Tax=Saponaria officinalis TaxID=3572 RepID=A0AAW1MLI8_SAPOF